MVDLSFTQQPEFQEAHRANERRERIHTGKVASALVVFLMPAGVVLDWAVYPDEVVPFLWIRLFGSALGAVLWILHASSFGQKHIRWLGLPIPFVPAFCIVWMIYRTGDPISPYYAGLNLVLLAISVVGHWNLIESLIVTGGVTIMYFLSAAAQSSFFANWSRDTQAGIVNNLYFLILTGVIVVTGNTFYNRLRFREFCLAYELEKNKQQLEESNRKLTELDQIKGRFFANISHELRTPLTLIISPLETILARFRGTLDADTVGLLQTMQSNGLRLLKLINDLLDLVRLDSGVMHVKREPVALDEFLRGMASAARPIADDKRIDLVASVAPDIGLVMVDRDKLEKIVLNLQFNALKFTPADGRVELKMNRQDGQLILQVSDTGIGIPKDKLPQMFERFMQVDTSSRRKYQGVGIGLALVKELVEVQGGQVSVESVEGQGSTFTVRMPYLEAPPDAVPAPAVELPQVVGQAQSVADPNGATAQPTATVSSQEWLSNLYHRANLFGTLVAERNATPVSGAVIPKTHARTVLVADDQPDMLRFIKSELAPHYNIIEATDGQQAVDKAAATTPDIILLDMMMPEKDGIQAAREIRAAHATQNVPIVLITAHVDEETKLNALRAGASDFLPKPFSTTELHVRVRNLVESHEFQRRLAEQNIKLAETIELLKATETQLVQSEKVASLGRLSAGIIHEINNPLNFAVTGLYVLKHQGSRLATEEPKEFTEVLSDVEDGLERMKNIIFDLRSFTHPDASRQESVKITDVIRSSLRMLSSEWKDKVQIEQVLPPDLSCRANKNKLTQVFVNLLQNALDALKDKPAGPEPPMIRIDGYREEREDGRVIVTVRDNGEGIEPKNLAKIFDPFFTTRDIGKGMGMGLSICYRIIQELNGNISVASERGKFCEFTIQLPRADSEKITA
jgi:signal transduction histidine kinase